MSQEEKKTLQEQDLTGVSGGGLECNGNCYFVPTAAVEKKLFDGAIYVKCDSTCFGAFGANCSCHGSLRCKDKYHRVEQLVTGQWGPAPSAENNHSASDKLFRMT